MYGSARDAYDNATKASASNRDLEAHALFKAARMLEDCRLNWNAPDRAARLEEALAYQQRLWTFFQTELSAPTHPLNPDVRSWLLSLSIFLDRRILQLREHPDPEALEPLIRINREIALGLSGAKQGHVAGTGDPAI